MCNPRKDSSNSTLVLRPSPRELPRDLVSVPLAQVLPVPLVVLVQVTLALGPLVKDLLVQDMIEL
jgi:hypothetical protein